MPFSNPCTLQASSPASTGKDGERWNSTESKLSQDFHSWNCDAAQEAPVNPVVSTHTDKDSTTRLFHVLLQGDQTKSNANSAESGNECEKEEADDHFPRDPILLSDSILNADEMELSFLLEESALSLRDKSDPSLLSFVYRYASINLRIKLLNAPPPTLQTEQKQINFSHWKVMRDEASLIYMKEAVVRYKDSVVSRRFDHIRNDVVKYALLGGLRRPSMRFVIAHLRLLQRDITVPIFPPKTATPLTALVTRHASHKQISKRQGAPAQHNRHHSVGARASQPLHQKCKHLRRKNSNEILPLADVQNSVSTATSVNTKRIFGS